MHIAKVGKIFTKNPEDEKETVLSVRNDGIWENGMGMTTAFTDNAGNTNLLIDRFSMNDVNDGSIVISMNLTVPTGMTEGTFFRFR